MIWSGGAGPLHAQDEGDPSGNRSAVGVPTDSSGIRPDDVRLAPRSDRVSPDSGGRRMQRPESQASEGGQRAEDTIRLEQSAQTPSNRTEESNSGMGAAQQTPDTVSLDTEGGREPEPESVMTPEEGPTLQDGPNGDEVARTGPNRASIRNEGAVSVAGSDTTGGGPRIQLQPAQMPVTARDTISTLSVSNADLRNVLRGIGEQYGVNLIVEDNIEKSVTVRLSRITVLEALQVICQEHDLSLIQSGPVFRIRTPPDAPPEPPQVSYENGRLTVNLSDDKLSAVAEALTRKTSTNVILSDGVDGRISGFLQDVPLESGLSMLLDNNGYRLRTREEIFVIDRKQRRTGPEGERRSGQGALWVDAERGRVDLNVQNAPVEEVLREVVSQMDLNLVTYQSPEGRISASVRDMSVQQVFDLLFRATDLTYREKDSTYFVGTRQTSSIATTELVSLEHVKAERVPEMLPQTVKQKATIKVISEHNGLMITGANDAIDELRQAIEALDKPTPLILIEALVVDFTTTDLFELGFDFGQDQEQSEQAKNQGYRFGEDGFQLDGEDEKANEYLKGLLPLTSNFGIENIGELPDDFFFHLQALSEEGKVDIRSRPQVAALSGHSANIEIGQTQYFILRKETPVRSPEGGAIVQETERFEKIEANVSLEITPWVTSSGEVTTEIRPEFSQPVGEFSSDTPPTINTRILESTVRLKEGETIILGGLIRDEKNVQKNKIPILGSIPLLGRLFRSQSTNTEKSELVIYLTPHVFYGKEEEPDRWEQLRDEMDLRDPRSEQ